MDVGKNGKKMIGHILCKLGFHRWGIRTDVTPWTVDDYAWCKRENCRYTKPMLVNREKNLIGKKVIR